MLLDRVKLRLKIEDDSQNEILQDLINSAVDDICLYIGEDECPDKLQSTCVDITVTTYRLLGLEGLQSEQVDVINRTYIASAISIHQNKLDMYLLQKEKAEQKLSRKVKFY